MGPYLLKMASEVWVPTSNGVIHVGSEGFRIRGTHPRVTQDVLWILEMLGFTPGSRNPGFGAALKKPFEASRAVGAMFGYTSQGYDLEGTVWSMAAQGRIYTALLMFCHGFEE